MMACTIISNGSERQIPGNEYEPPFTTIMTELKAVMEQLVQEGHRKFYTTAEWGVPLWAGEVLFALRLKYPDISICIVAPHEEQAKDWSEAWRERYFRLHRIANEVVMIHQQWCEEAEADAIQYALKRSDLLYIFGKPEDELLAESMALEMGINVKYF